MKKRSFLANIEILLFKQASMFSSDFFLNENLVQGQLESCKFEEKCCDMAKLHESKVDLYFIVKKMANFVLIL